MRLPVSLFTALSLAALCGVDCGSQDLNSGTGGSGNPTRSTGGTTGAPSGSGGSAPGGALAGGAGGTGGSPATTNTGGRVGNAGGTGGALPGGSDDGRLFTDASVPTSSGGMTGTADASVTQPADAGTDGPPGNGHTATCSIPTVGLTAVFTQTGTDVKVVITATKCPAGSHVIQIHAGFSCDSAATQGGIWGGARGTGIGNAASTITCNAAMQGALTYTRLGTNSATNWTVGDHNTLTDVTLHPMMLDATNCGTFF